MYLNTKDVKHIFFDCDDTLCLWDTWPIEGVDTIPFEFHGRIYNLTPHKGHIELLKKHHADGHEVIIWSAAGPAWAKCVVDKLGLEPYVKAVIGKPNVYYDDLKSTEFMPESNRVYIKPPMRPERYCQTCGTVKILIEKEPLTYKCVSCEENL